MYMANVNFVTLGQQLLIAGQEKNALVFLASIVFGLACLLFSYRLLKICITAAGLIAGFLIGSSAGSFFGLSSGQSLLVGLVIGAILAIAAFSLYEVGVFLFAGIMTFCAVINILNVATQMETQWWTVAAAFILALIVAVRALRFVRAAVIWCGAISGAILLSTSLLPLIGVESLPSLLIVAAVIAAIGVIGQFGGFAKLKALFVKEESTEEESVKKEPGKEDLEDKKKEDDTDEGKQEEISVKSEKQLAGGTDTKPQLDTKSQLETKPGVKSDSEVQSDSKL